MATLIEEIAEREMWADRATILGLLRSHGCRLYVRHRDDERELRPVGPLAELIAEELERIWVDEEEDDQ